MPPMPRALISGWRAKEIPTNSERILDADSANGTAGAWPLFSCAQTRTVESSAAISLPPYTLMQRAGLAVARLAMAIAPHARHIWIPCGPGNNGGDGYEAAVHLKSWGKSAIVTLLTDTADLPPDAAYARQRAVDAGVAFAHGVPARFELCIDALFGIGRARAWDNRCSSWITQINAASVPVLAVDLPSGLDGDTGAAVPLHVKATHTLKLLTLKPGAFTADGRQACGDIWFNKLGIDTDSATACAELNVRPARLMRAHNSHKGSYGDVCVVGGQPGMTGAALLAARAALHAGAGRVYTCLLGPQPMELDGLQPELMFRTLSRVDLASMAVVAGCGGGDAIQAVLPMLIDQSGQLVLDADGLNHVANDKSLRAALRARRPQTTVLTPHPLEAARLLQISTAQVQANRIPSAQALADQFACTVVLKGSGTVIAAPAILPRINTSGNARLATAGTGDVLAGMVGARLAAGEEAFAGACNAVYRHGQMAGASPTTRTLTAQDLVRAL